MQEHLKSKHAYVSLPENKSVWKIGKTERDDLKKMGAFGYI